jgi:hypothetical protein
MFSNLKTRGTHDTYQYYQFLFHHIGGAVEYTANSDGV